MMELTEEQYLELSLFLVEKLKQIGNKKSETLIKEISDLYPIVKEELKTGVRNKRKEFFLLCAEGARMMAQYTRLQDIKKRYNIPTISNKETIQKSD